MKQLYNYKSNNRSGFILKRILVTVIFTFSLMVSFGSVLAQKVSLTLKNASIKEVLFELNEKNDFGIAFNEKDVINNTKRITATFKDVSVEDVLKKCFEGTTLNYSVDGNAITVYDAVPQIKKDSITRKVNISGKVVDTKKTPIAGATLIVLGTTQGAITDDKGLFNIVANTGTELEISFVGFKTMKMKITEAKTNLIITLDADAMVMDDVVVTGFINKNKNSFTGSVKSLNIEELKSVSNNNLIGAIAMMTPGLRIVENNQQGSNPNRLPEMVIRGASSLSTEADSKANQPVIILDGVEITLRDLYDIDINDIERVDILKDASATALYGEKASNGVIVVERKKVLNEKLRLRYNFDSSFDFPDLNTYDYLNAADKLEFERLAGLYNFQIYDEYEDYNKKKKLVRKGIDTDWLSQPLRSGYSINNSVGASGRGNGMTYRINANYKTTHGVMKGDYRNNIGLSSFLSYHVANKVTVSYTLSFANTKSKESPYGKFSDYVMMNPYDSPYDEYGNLIKLLSWETTNPLYESSCGNSIKQNSTKLTNSINARWDVAKGFFVTANGSITNENVADDLFKSPTSADFIKEPELDRKGSYTINKTTNNRYEGKMVLNYSKEFGEGTLLSLNLGGEISKETSVYDGYTATGFYKESLNKPNFAAQFLQPGRPSGGEDVSASMAMIASANFILKNKYFVDGSFRRSGSSKFGANNRYAPFWAAGIGWNLHNEDFAKKDWIKTFRLRYSYGVTGNVSFDAYQAITTYQYNNDNFYLHGIGAIPRAMGNNDLTWQSTGMHDIGANIDLFDERLSITLDYYRKDTKDMLIDLAIPPSVGQSSIMANLGKMRNTGFEFDISAVLVRTKDWRFSLKFNGAYNKNTILSISNALEKMNEENGADKSMAPKIMYFEGESSTAIYAVKSAGINPATGQEVFINRRGQYTLVYDPNDKIALGDRTPFMEGAIFPTLTYKNISVSAAIQYQFGGQIYNQTRANNVENVNPKHNVDQRAFDQRWKKTNDIPPYLDIANRESREGMHTSRFIEDDNTLQFTTIEVGYEFNPEILKKIGFKRLRLSFSASQPFRISTVRYERGTEYPFSRGYTFSISPTF